MDQRALRQVKALFSDRIQPRSELAVYGGPAAFPDGPPNWPRSSDRIVAALEAVYASGDWGRYQGEQCQALSAELAAFFQPVNAPSLGVTLCCSGTIAVELALRGLGVGPGDEVVIAAYDFPGNFRAVESIGARVVLVDIDPHSGNLDPETLWEAVGPDTKAVVASHLHGGFVRMERLMEVARKLKIAVVEDACQAMGGMVDARKAGTWGDAGVLSFGGSKLLTAGRGGAVLSSDAAVHQRIKVFSERGNQAYPLSELQAAVIRPQLALLAEHTRYRADRARQLISALAEVSCLTALIAHNTPDLPAFYKLGFWYCPDAAAGTTRADFLAAVQAEGIALFEGFRGFGLRGSRRCRKVGSLMHANEAANRMAILHHPVLMEPPEVIDRVAAAIAKVSRACPLVPGE